MCNYTKYYLVIKKKKVKSSGTRNGGHLGEQQETTPHVLTHIRNQADLLERGRPGVTRG